MHIDAPIGVLDSGVGGLSVMKYLHQMLPCEDFIYLGDTARTPYGSRPEAEIRSFVCEMLDWFETQGIKQVVLACNTITMLGIDTLKEGHSYYFIGMSKGEKLLAEASIKKKVGVFATEFTISTQAHKKAIEAYDPSVKVYPMACPDFVPLIEGEHLACEHLTNCIRTYATPLKEAGIDALILSCTHYPFVREQVQKEFGPDVRIIDPAEATSELAIKQLKAAGLYKKEGSGRVRICCTRDLPRVKRLAALMLPTEDCTFEEISLKPA